jgi:hypothetical protein
MAVLRGFIHAHAHFDRSLTQSLSICRTIEVLVKVADTQHRPQKLPVLDRRSCGLNLDFVYR